MSENSKYKSTAVKEACAVLLLIAAEIFFFRNIIFNENMLGDLGDGRFVPLITDHWYKFFQGKESFGRIPIFYPNTTALGYSDFHFGYGIVYSLLRLFGMEFYAAFKWCIILIHFAGTLVMYLLLRKELKCDVIPALTGTVAFSYCCALTGISNHPQLFAVAMLPELMLFIMGFIGNFQKRKERNIYAYLTVFWFVLITYTSWYIACFTGIFALVFGIVYLCLMSGRDNKNLKMIQKWIKTCGLDMAGWIVFMAVLFIPFLSIYIPVMKEGGFYGFDPTYLPEAIHLLNVGDDNLLLGWFMKLIHMSERCSSNEFREGFSLMTIICFLASAVHVFRKKKKKHDYSGVCVRAAIVSVLICILLILKWNDKGDSLWAMVYEVLIPARAVHAVVRFLLWLTFPVALIISVELKECSILKKDKTGIVLPSLVLLLMFLSVVNTGGMISAFERTDRVAFINGISEPPADMKVFFLMDSSVAGKPEYVYQLDAYEVAMKIDKPTMNGYSGHFPESWGVWNVCGDDYYAYVNDWALRNGLEEGIYAYDEATNSWQAFTPQPY